MKLFKFLSIAFVAILLGCEPTTSNKKAEVLDVPAENSDGREYYFLKTYTLDTDEQVATTDDYLQNAFIPGMKRLGIGPIGVFKDRPAEEDTVDQTFVLIPFKSLDQFEQHDKQLMDDQRYRTAGASYLEAAHDNPPYTQIESVLIKAFEDMPQMATPKLNGPRAERIYELRSYESATELDYWNKVDMFNAGGEIILFDELEFNAVFYGEVLSGSNMPNLMYMTTHKNQETRDKNWDAFRTSPKWEALKADPKYQNNVSHIDIYFLYPTEYSDY